MAGLASRCCRYMVRSGWFAKCSGTVMATRTACADASVIHRSTFETGGGFMASLATSSSGNMIGWFG